MEKLHCMFGWQNRFLTQCLSEASRLLQSQKMGIEFAGNKPNGGTELRFQSATEGDSDTSWSNPFGKNNPIRDHFKQLELAFEMAEGPVRRMNVIFRAYDDGAAFRYRCVARTDL
jgi:alpha-glucosidase